MKAKEKYCISYSATMGEAIAAIQMNCSRCVVVIGKNDKVIGVFSEGDVLRAILAGTDLHAPLCNLIKPSFRYIQEMDRNAARRLFLSGISLIPFLDQDFRLKSVLTMNDVFNEIE